MRVITGFARGKKLVTLDGNDIRPTTDRVKEGIFSSIQFDLEGASVLDLFAGSGQLGIEALSRGADKAYFVDNSKKSLETVKKNLAITGLENKSKLFNMNGHDFLKITDQKFDFIFLDPPYDCVFNDYGNIDMMNGFDETQHRRLANDFRNLPCRSLMVIGKTPLTEELYGEYIFDEYYKNYAVNIKNRFNNDKMHIVVKNY